MSKIHEYLKSIPKEEIRNMTPYKKFALEAAGDLLYDVSVAKAIRASDNDNDISRIMLSARSNDGKLKGGE